MDWPYIAPEKLQQNAFIESFNGKLRDKCLFVSFSDAWGVLEIWQHDYNPLEMCKHRGGQIHQAGCNF